MTLPHALVLSLFPGIGMLDAAFEAEGFCVVRGPDVIWGGDIRTFTPAPGHFDGIIGGPPCQAFSPLSNLVRAKGLEPRFGNLIPEYVRCVEAAAPQWFLMENVSKAPDPDPAGYDVHTFLLDNSALDSGDGFGQKQMRTRRFWFGVRGDPAPDLRRWIKFATFDLPSATQAVASDPRTVPDRHGGSGRVKVTSVGGHDGTLNTLSEYRILKQQSVTGRHDGADCTVDRDYSPPRRTLGEMLELQGFPPDWLDDCPLTVAGKRTAVGNGVPLPMGRALAQAIRQAMIVMDGDAA